jgi:hypothetical protein
VINCILTSKPFKLSQAAGKFKDDGGGGTFITPASLVTFAGATFAIKIVMQVVVKLWNILASDLTSGIWKKKPSRNPRQILTLHSRLASCQIDLVTGALNLRKLIYWTISV